MTNTQALARLAENAKTFAKAYVEVKEALVKEGVPPKEASEAARYAAHLASVQPEEPEYP